MMLRRLHTCMCSSFWLGNLILLFINSESAFARTSLSTIPATNTLATNYRNFIVRAEFPTSDVSATCVWKYPGRTTSSFIVVVSGITCNPVNNPPVELVSCVNDGTTIASNLTILQPLSAGSLNVSVACDGRTLRTLPTVTVQDCSVDNNAVGLTYNDSTPFSYNNKYTLSCASGYTGSPVISTCKADATFSLLPTCTYVPPPPPGLTDWQKIIGIILGACVAFIASILVIVILYCKRRRKKRLRWYRHTNNSKL